MSVKDEVLFLLRDRDWVSCEDFEKIFPPKTEGHLSWGQRLRELRTDGYRIDKRKKANCKHTFEYRLVMPETKTELESTLTRDFQAREEKLNTVAAERQIEWLGR